MDENDRGDLSSCVLAHRLLMSERAVWAPVRPSPIGGTIPPQARSGPRTASANGRAGSIPAMRVVVVSAHCPPNFVSGGTLAPQRLARALRARGHEVSVY